MVALLDLSKQLFTRCNSSSCRNLSVRQLLIIVSDGRGVFHEGREKVMQSMMKARQAGYFCIILIVENRQLQIAFWTSGCLCSVGVS